MDVRRRCFLRRYCEWTSSAVLRAATLMLFSNEHLGRLEGCDLLAADQLDDLRDRLVAVVHRASSLVVTDPDRRSSLSS